MFLSLVYTPARDPAGIGTRAQVSSLFYNYTPETLEEVRLDAEAMISDQQQML